MNKKFIPRPVKTLIERQLGKLGFYWVKGLGHEIRTIEEFRRDAAAILASRDTQTLETVEILKQKYETTPIVGEVRVHRLMELLAQVIDPSNTFLYSVSQLTHTLQVLESMEESQITDRDLIVAALIHDLGKIALLTGEKPEFIECGGKFPLGPNIPGSGFENCNFIFDHTDIVYARFKPYVNERVAWLIRWHSVQKECGPLMDAHDRAMFEAYFKTFVVHDRTYIFYHRPKYQISRYYEILEEAFPKPILFVLALSLQYAAKFFLSLDSLKLTLA